MRRRLLAVGVPVLGLVAAPPPPAAWAASSPGDRRVEWSPFRNRDGQRIDPGRLAGIIRISADVTDPSGMWGWALDVDAAPGSEHPGFGRVCEERLSAEAETAHIVCDWDTSRLPGEGASANQGYVVRVSLDDGSEDPPGDGSRDVTVSNPASAPGRLRVRRARGRIVRLHWSPPPEPDISGYVVGRSRDGTRWQIVAEPEGPAHEERGLEPGRYVFRVGARRQDDPAAAPERWTVSDPVVVPGAAARPDRPAPSDTRPDPDSGAGSDESGPADSHQQPADGHEQPADGHEQPAAGHEQPADGHAQPAERNLQAGQVDGRPGLAPADPPPSQPARPAPGPAETSAFLPDDTPGVSTEPAPATTWTLSPPPAARGATRPRGAATRPVPRRPAAGAPPAPRPAAVDAAPEAPDNADNGYALALPYGSPVKPGPEALPADGPAGIGVAPATRPSGVVRQPANRRRLLASLAFGQVCFVLAALARSLVHRASGHRWSPPLARSVRRCPRCRARLNG